MVQKNKTLVCIVSDSSILCNICIRIECVGTEDYGTVKAEKIETFLGALDLFLEVTVLS